jgi:hypothetical protein
VRDEHDSIRPERPSVRKHPAELVLSFEHLDELRPALVVVGPLLDR